jgi:hypothetical protein
MANRDHNRVFGYAELTALAGRFAQHAAAITNPARQDVAKDLLLAARMAHKFASLRFRVANIAQKAIEPPDNSGTATLALELRAALDDAERDVGEESA